MKMLISLFLSFYLLQNFAFISGIPYAKTQILHKKIYSDNSKAGCQTYLKPKPTPTYPKPLADVHPWEASANLSKANADLSKALADTSKC